MIGMWLAPLPKPKEDAYKKRRPPDEQHCHEPMTKFNDVIDLITVR